MKVISVVLTDEDLMLQVQKDQTQAIDCLIHRYQNILFRFLYRLTVQESDTEDLFQETWMRVVRYRQSYQKGKKFSSWLFQIALNCTRDLYKKAPQGVALDNLSFSQTDPGEKRLENQELVLKLMEQLPLPFREVVVLKFFEEMKEKDIAEMLEIPIGTVKSRSHKALSYLRKHFPAVDEII
jgi:RNA polymerase sigma-70 factor (ECF subfamily)